MKKLATECPGEAWTDRLVFILKVLLKITSSAIPILTMIVACSAPQPTRPFIPTMRQTTQSIPASQLTMSPIPTSSPTKTSITPLQPTELLVPASSPTKTSINPLQPTKLPVPTSLPTMTPVPTRLASTPVTASIWEPISQIGGSSRAIAVQGHLAYLNIGPRLVILDMADQAHPALLGQTPPLPEPVEGLAVTENHAYVAAGKGGLRVIDISNPAKPVEVGFYKSSKPARNLAVAEGLAYIAAEDGLYILDVSNPTSPIRVGFCRTPGAAREVVVVQNMAYVAEAVGDKSSSVETGGMRIVDISDRKNPNVIGYYPMNPRREEATASWYEITGAGHVAVAGDYAYLLYYTGKKAGVRVVDISNPAAPKKVGDYVDYFPLASDIKVVEKSVGNSKHVYAYLATNYNGGLWVLDLSNPAQPARLDNTMRPMAWGLAVTGNTLFIAAESGLHVADISDPAHVSEVGFYSALGSALGVAIAGDMAFVAVYFRWDLVAVDISDPARPVPAGIYRSLGVVKDVAIVGTKTYVANGKLELVDWADPAHPQRTGLYSPSPYGLIYGVAVAGDYAYVSVGEQSEDLLQVLNVSDPAVPILVNTYKSPAKAQYVIDPAIVIAKNIAYFTGGDELHILDLSNPARPVEIGSYVISSEIRDMAITGNHAYLVLANELQIVDVSDPKHPFKVGSFVSEGIERVAANGNYIYVVGGNRLYVIDVSNPAALKEILSYSPAGGVYDVKAVGGKVYVAAGNNGLVILRHHSTP